MEYEDYERATLALSYLPASARMAAYRALPDVADGGPLSPWEEKLVETQMAERGQGRPWLAVGEAGLQVGDRLTPDRARPGAGLAITDVAYVAETAFDIIPAAASPCLYVVEPIGPVTIDVPAFRLSMLCTVDAGLDQDAPEVMQVRFDAACLSRCAAARIVQVLDLSRADEPKH